MDRRTNLQRNLLTLFRNKGGDFLVDFVGASGSYSVALWDGDDLKASPRSSTWTDRIGGHVITMYDRDVVYTITEADVNVNGHNSIAFPNPPVNVGANARNTTVLLEMDGADALHDAWTFYIVMKPIAKVGNRYYWGSGDEVNYPAYCRYSTPNIALLQGGSGLGNISPQPAIGEWIVLSLMAKEGTNTSKHRVNNNAPVAGTLSVTYGSSFRGITLNHDGSALTNAFRSSGVGVACILMRQGEDSEAETLAINTFLMEKYGLP